MEVILTDMDLHAILKNLPAEPGVYLYKDANDTVIYVGKARVLKNRVRSYFHSSELNAKTKQLVSNIADIQYIVTGNELEALLLENNLIKQYKPKYNILLKDDKGYPYLRIDPAEAFPKLELARRMKFDGALYFGPYHGGGSARTIADIALELYPLRTCNYDFTKSTKIRPCLKYHIGRCPAPCVERDNEQYRQNVDRIIDFLKGNQNNALDALKEKMERAAANLEFELAAEIRDKLKRADEILAKQKIVLDKDQNIDVISVILKDTYAVICSLYVRSGRLIGVYTEEQSGVEYDTENQLLTKYIIQHYTSGAVLPKEIVCAIEPEDKEITEKLISEANNKAVHITVSQRGKKHDLCFMAQRNAQERLEKSASSLSYKEQRIHNGLQELQRVLGLKEPPYRLECFDISHIQGTDTVASMVVFSNGRPDKKEYRRFKIRQAQNNDFASMREVTTRRYTSGKNKQTGFEKMPDLIIIDGGKGQLSSAKQVLNELSLNIPMIGLAKRLEEIYIPGSSLPILLPLSSPALQILQAIRDEAHRFAITFHRSLRNKHSLISALDNIPGIGAKRKKELMKAFSTVSRIQAASLEELAAVPSMNTASAQEVYRYFSAQNLSRQKENMPPQDNG